MTATVEGSPGVGACLLAQFPRVEQTLVDIFLLLHSVGSLICGTDGEGLSGERAFRVFSRNRRWSGFSPQRDLAQSFLLFAAGEEDVTAGISQELVDFTSLSFTSNLKSERTAAAANLVRVVWAPILLPLTGVSSPG